MRDPYSVLGVPPDATDEEIKKHIESLAESIIPMLISTIRTRRLPRRNLRRFRLHMTRL